MLRLAMYEANLFIAKVLLGLVALARNCNSLSNLAYELLRSPSFLSGFGSNGVFGLRGMPMGFALSSPSFSNIFSIYFFCEIVTEHSSIAILILTILDGSPSSVICHSDFTLSSMAVIALSDEANSNRSSTQTVIIAIPL